MNRKPTPREQERWIAAIRTLNRRWSKRALSLWRGEVPATDPDRLYREFDSLLSSSAIAQTAAWPEGKHRRRVRHGLIDHYLQRKLMPHEVEMQAWSRGAAAHVEGEKIRFQDVIPWCQKSSTLLKRQKLQQETGPLCKLLKPFAVNYWRVLIDTLTGSLGYESYIDYCRQKKGIDYAGLYALVKQLLAKTRRGYFQAMESWSRDRFGLPLDRLSRFDAIYLLSLSQWDRLCPVVRPETTLAFFQHWDLTPDKLPGLHLDVKAQRGKSSQAITILVNIPHDIHILMRPEGGWIDLETLWHEWGHGISGALVDPALSAVDRELVTAFSLSEVYAFLLQRMALSTPLLSDVMGLSADVVATIRHYKRLKDLAVFRRYAAKFISEYEMFSRDELIDGHPYAQTMADHTGFYHQPESHLFDLVPEFYCADYLLGWLGEATLSAHLKRSFGDRWCFARGAGERLRDLWRQGLTEETSAFFETNGLGPISAAALQRRWQGFADENR